MLPRRPFPARPRLAVLLLAALLCGGAAAPALADQQSVVSASGVALAGRDAVAYFSKGGAVPGSANHALKWRGAVWFFATEANRATFEMNPSAYAPRYGGHCPITVIEGKPRPGNPDLFVIRDGRLILARNEAARERIRNEADLIAEADAAWKKLGNR